MTRNSPIWWLGIIAAVLSFSLAHFGLLHIDVIWKERIELASGLIGILSAFFRMSPLSLSDDSTLAGTSDHTKTLMPFDSSKK